MTPVERAEQVYGLTKGLALPNAIVQGISGIFGSGIPLLIDAGALFFYWKMWNDIRAIYGHGAITKKAAIAYLRPNISYLVQDLIFDKGVGAFVPIVGIPLNFIFAKALTWRLGAWFGLLSAMAKARSANNIPDPILTRYSLALVQQFFPPETLAIFTESEPDKDDFINFVASLEGLSDEEARKRLQNALDALQGKGDKKPT